MRRITMLIPLLLVLTFTASAQNPTRRIQPQASDSATCPAGAVWLNTTTHLFKICLTANSVSTVGAGSGVTNSAGANVIPKSNGTNLVASQITDDGADLVLAGSSDHAIKLSGDGFIAIGDNDGVGNGTSFELNDSTGRIVFATPNGSTQMQGDLNVTGATTLGGGVIGIRPTCSITHRKKVWVSEGGTGAKDTAAICLKDASDVYAWRTIY